MTNTRTINLRLAAVSAIGILMLTALVGTYTSSLAHAAITASSTPPIITNVVATPNNTGATVTWTTDQSSDTQAAYGPTTAYNASSTLSDTVSGATAHTAFIGGLTPNTLYHFEVMSSNGSTTGTSTDMTFTTTNTASTTASTTSVTTGTVTNITTTGATLNATNGSTTAADNTSFWWGPTSAGPFTSGTNPSIGQLPSGWMKDNGIGATTTNGTFSENITGLAPNTTYFFAPWVESGGTWFPGTVQSFMTLASSTASTTPSVTTNVATGISSSDATLNATNGPVTSQGEAFWISTTPINTSSPTIPSGVFSTPIMSGVAANAMFSSQLSSLTTSGVPSNLPAIQPNTTYYVVAWSEVNGTWYPGAVLNFTTTATSTTDITTLQNEITTLQQQVATLQAQVAALMGGGGGGGTTTPPSASNPTVDQNGQTFARGGSIDFTGRNFNHEENVTVTLGGNQVASSHADGGGNFSTGSFAGPTATGSYTYTFTGSGGDHTTATITVQ